MLVSPKIILVCCAYYFSEALHLSTNLLSEADTLTRMIPVVFEGFMPPRRIYYVMSKGPDILKPKFFFVLRFGVKRNLKYLTSSMLLVNIHQTPSMLLEVTFR